MSALLAVTAMATVSAVAPIGEAKMLDGETERAVLKTTGAEVTRALGRPAQLVPERFATGDNWAFVRGRLTERGGGRLSYAGTPFAEAAAGGFKSDAFAALLRRQGANWRVVELAVGPTDVAWATWGQDHRAPAVLFQE